ncbi:glycosyl hydrolase 2 galactose-binding domain-containing protein [Teredinibacter franksiae]|uniref:glycosyl hydrolase 2 galactose-binding domain-containing protein n=1 Tax=Teredinibacter franksiae TaxID=2761453 RepID=UPI001624521E|nr:hypothetical protein [Teredinibacter franksiae]
MQLTHWKIGRSAADEFASPEQVPHHAYQWQSMAATTVADVMQAYQLPCEKLDEYDWWFSCSFSASEKKLAESLAQITCDGLATLAEVWLNGTCLGESNNLFLPYCAQVNGLLRRDNQLVVVFRSLAHALGKKHVRPAWKTRLVDQQNLRWYRTSLIGYIPAWMPDKKPVGFIGDVRIFSWEDMATETFSVRPDVKDDVCYVDVQAEFDTEAVYISRAQIVFDINGIHYPIACQHISSEGVICVPKQRIELGSLPLWWPHTHGEPKTHRYKIILKTYDGGKASTTVLKQGALAFRCVSLERPDNNVVLKINSKAVFSRGACWITPDIIRLKTTTEQLQKLLLLARDAGINMLRIPGTMFYEQSEFYALCDQIGILVWQDCMFANMDYPVGDEGFIANVGKEVEYQFKRLQQYACVVVFCGGSEVYQQAALLGIEPQYWNKTLFEQLLPTKLHEAYGEFPYFPSTPCEGDLPIHLEDGICHYWGVGAYRGDLTDPQKFDIKFSSECLGFSNIPSEETLKKVFGLAAPAVHTPLWKHGVPRDSAAGWDFEDIRDHYLKALFAIEARELRYEDNDRYHRLSRLVSGEAMRAVFRYWRSSRSNCFGGVIWFYRDLVEGAGWGLIDSYDTPKSCYHLLGHVLQSQQVLILDEAFNGHRIELINERNTQLNAVLHIGLVGFDGQLIDEIVKSIQLEESSSTRFSLDEEIGRFTDTTHAYKFGAQRVYALVAELRSSTDVLISQDVVFPNRKCIEMQPGNLECTLAEKITSNHFALILQSNTFLEYVTLASKKYRFNKNILCLLPGKKYKVFATSDENSMAIAEKVRVLASAINTKKDFRFVL